jgi:Ser/Thr protein kinase RdoA (MazF antagonist)
MRPYTDWLQGSMRAYGARLAAVLGAPRQASFPRLKSDTILAKWPIGDYRLRQMAGGSSRSIFMVHTASAELVLRREEGDEREWVDLQMRVLRQLQERHFPYETPRIVPTQDGVEYYFDGSDYWYLYEFIRGTAALEPSNERRAAELGRLVASFAKATEGFAISMSPPLYGLDLFSVDGGTARLTAGLERLEKAGNLPELERLAARSLDPIMRAYAEVSAADIAATNALAITAAYYDWNNKNIICRRGRVSGLIDYDSLAEAPRLVDFQNALTYVMVGKEHIDRSMMAAFADAYNAVAPLTAIETVLLRPLMIDRAIALLCDLLERLSQGYSRDRETRAKRMFHMLHWLAGNRDALVDIATPRRASLGVC